MALTGCNGEKSAPPAPPPAAVTVASPILHTVQGYFELNGHLEAVETVQITARVKGFLKDIYFTEGEEVNLGEPLFRIDSREYEAMVKKADADRLKAVAEARRARSEADRAAKLVASKSMSPEDAEQRMAARDAADAVVKQFDAMLESAKLEFEYTKIHAPIAGQISRTLITKGNLVGQNDSTLTTIVSVDPLYVYFDAAERDLVEYQHALRTKALPTPTSREFPVEIGVTGEEGYPHKGKIDFRENKVDSGTGTIRIRGRIPNPQMPPGNARLLYPGLYARVRVPNGPPRELPVIPEDALMTGQEGRYVYVIDEKDTVQKRTVTLGGQVWKGVAPANVEAGWRLDGTPANAVTSVVAIAKGIGPGDRVVVNGLTRARPGATVAPSQRALMAPTADKK